MAGRLSLALERGIVTLPEDDTGPPLQDPFDTLVFGSTKDSDLAGLDRDRTELFARYADAGEALDFARTNSPDSAKSIIVLAPRSRQAQRAYLRRARDLTDGPIIVDGPKTHGIDALYRELRSRADVSEAWSKAHGKVFSVAGGDFSDWPDIDPVQHPDGWWRAPGVFSEDGIDKASAFLAETLPASLSGTVIDLGAGWGYLSRAILDHKDVNALHLVENDRLALDAARLNVTDPRAEFHWADALAWRPEAPVDHVITNPPFHQGRAADPSLGQAFIRAAAAMLKPKGQLWLVANRHLPYEGTLKDAFRTVELHTESPSFKIFHAKSPTRRKG